MALGMLCDIAQRYSRSVGRCRMPRVTGSLLGLVSTWHRRHRAEPIDTLWTGDVVEPHEYPSMLSCGLIDIVFTSMACYHAGPFIAVRLIQVRLGGYAFSTCVISRYRRKAGETHSPASNINFKSPPPSARSWARPRRKSCRL